MPISRMDEYPAHQTSETIDHVATSDRNFYDRFYFNCHASSDEIFLITGLGQYPNLGVTDAFVSISHGHHHYVVRASRELGHDRLDMGVGPFRIEILEGLMKIRVICEPNEWGVAFDLTFTGSVPAIEEPKTFQRRHGRITSDTSRFAQVGTWQGHIEVAGQHYNVTPDRWQGARDRSWGVRPVGEAEHPGIRLKDLRENVAGLFHHWMPMQFPDYMIKVQFDEQFDGTRLLEEAVRIPNIGQPGEQVSLGMPSIDIDYISGTREMQKALITLTPAHGEPLRIRSTPLRTVYLKAGSGYIPDGTWGHGWYQGGLKVEGLSFDMSTAEERMKWALLNETLARFELETGEIAYGLHENLVIGTYTPHGFGSGEVMAP
jgi:hypothetical protein